MEKLIFKISLFLLALLFFACGDDSSVNNDENDPRKLFFTGEENNGASVMEILTSEITYSQDLQETASFKESGTVSKILNHGGRFYLLAPEEMKVLVLDADNYKIEHNIDFSSEGLKPLEMVFAPNATAGYVIFENSGLIKVIDLTNHQIAREIKLESILSDIFVQGNVLYAAGLMTNKIYAVATNDNSLKNSVSTVIRPYLLDFSNNNNELIVVGTGFGKVTPEDSSSPAAVAYYDPETLDYKGGMDLNTFQVRSEDILPRSLINTINDWAFILIDGYVMRLDTKNRDRFSVFMAGDYSRQLYDLNSDEMYFYKYEQDIIQRTSAYNAVVLENISLPEKVSAFYLTR